MFDLNASQLLAPIPANTGIITFTIKVGGNVISDLFEVTQIVVNRMLNRISYATIYLNDSGVANQRLDTSDQDVFSPGNTIEIAVGYASEENVVFQGIIIRHNIKIKSNASPKLEIECKDIAVKMTIGRKNKYYIDQKDSDIIESIARDYDGMSTEVEDTEVKHPQMVQYFSTDWDFIVARADANAKVVATNDGKLVVKKPTFDAAPKFVLNYGSSIYEFEAEMDARNQYPSARASSWDPSQQAIISAEANTSGAGLVGGIGGGLVNAVSNIASGGGFGDAFSAPPNTDYTGVIGIPFYQVQHSGMFSNEEVQNWAKAQFQKSELAKSKGYVRFEGVADIYPGDTIDIQNVGARHSGKVFVTAVRHEVIEGTWFTKAQFGLEHSWYIEEFDDIQDKPASNLLPAVSGLQIGLVTQIENDPAGEDRILVRLPMIDIESEGIWARMASQDAGIGDGSAGRGAFFRPEVDDEVIVGFINDDPRNPIVLGMLNSSNKPAQIAASNENDEKGWITRSGIKMLFNDGQKSFTLETPDGKKVVVNDEEDAIQLEDQHGNKIIMNGDGIEIESSADLKLKAAGDVKVEGMNIKHTANQEFSGEGQSKSQLKSVGDVVITGTFVKINS